MAFDIVLQVLQARFAKLVTKWLHVPDYVVKRRWEMLTSRNLVFLILLGGPNGSSTSNYISATN
jgi:hypothetical protein